MPNHAVSSWKREFLYQIFYEWRRFLYLPMRSYFLWQNHSNSVLLGVFSLFCGERDWRKSCSFRSWQATCTTTALCQGTTFTRNNLTCHTILSLHSLQQSCSFQRIIHACRIEAFQWKAWCRIKINNYCITKSYAWLKIILSSLLSYINSLYQNAPNF